MWRENTLKKTHEFGCIVFQITAHTFTFMLKPFYDKLWLAAPSFKLTAITCVIYGTMIFFVSCHWLPCVFFPKEFPIMTANNITGCWCCSIANIQESSEFVMLNELLIELCSKLHVWLIPYSHKNKSKLAIISPMAAAPRLFVSGCMVRQALPSPQSQTVNVRVSFPITFCWSRIIRGTE